MAKKINLTDKSDTYTKVLLHFDESTTKDECGNTWTATGSPSISTTNAKFGKALQLDGNSYLSLNDGITLGGKDFTIDFFMFKTEHVANAAWFALTTEGSSERIIFFDKRDDSSTIYFSVYADIDYVYEIPVTMSTKNHIAIVYQHSSGLWTIYINGNSVKTLTYKRNRFRFDSFCLGKFLANYCKGSIDEFRVSDGIARWTENFTPPISPYYFDLKDFVKLYEIKPTPPAVAVYSSEKTGVEDSFTKALLHFDKSATKDENNNSWSIVGSADISSQNFKFGSNSLLINSSGSGLILNDTKNNLFIGYSPFTIDWWEYFRGNIEDWATRFDLLVGSPSASSEISTQFTVSQYSSWNHASFCIDANGSRIINYPSGVFPNSLNNWVHRAITRDANYVLRCYSNGVKTYETTFNYSIGYGKKIAIGASRTDNNFTSLASPFNGYICYSQAKL